MPSSIVASIPGRLRIRNRCLKNSDLLEKLGATLIGLEPSCSCQVNPKTGSLILFYDEQQCVKTKMESAVIKAIGALSIGANASSALAVPATPTAVSASRKRRVLLRKANRYSKYVMYASLGTSLVLAARGAKYGHAVAGAVFVTALGVHLAVHRRHLFS